MDSTIKLTEVSDVVTPAPETYPKNYNFDMESTWEEHIYSEGDEVSGTIDITSNGTHNVATYASANVQVPNHSTGTKQISSNGTHDVTDFASAEVSVPNSYTSSDEGKVVDNGALVSQTSKNITANGTVDTTLNNSVVVNVPQGITPTGTKEISITQNGTTTEDVSAYANAQITVNVSKGSYFEAFMKHTISDYEDDFTISVPGRFIGGSFPNLTRIRLNNATGFSGNPYFHFIVIGRNDMKVVMPKCTGAKMNAFNGSTSLKVLDFLGGSKLEAQMFYGCTNFNTLIIRTTNSVVPLDSVNVFYNAPFASGKAGGTLYVPSALISSYQSATNWSTILGYANNSIQAIEGSIYENAYADGTPISA